MSDQIVGRRLQWEPPPKSEPQNPREAAKRIIAPERMVEPEHVQALRQSDARARLHPDLHEFVRRFTAELKRRSYPFAYRPREGPSVHEWYRYGVAVEFLPTVIDIPPFDRVFEVVMTIGAEIARKGKLRIEPIYPATFRLTDWEDWLEVMPAEGWPLFEGADKQGQRLRYHKRMKQRITHG